MEDAGEIKWKNLPVKPQSPDELYRNISLIGRGSFGEVYFGRSLKSDNFVAIKMIYYKSDSSKRKFAKKEICALFQIENNHCVKVMDCFHLNHTVWIIMEYCIGSVFDLLRVKKNASLTEEEISAIISHITYGLIYIHTKNFIHRDVKAANMLVTNSGIVKIADFGNVSLKNESDTFVSSSYWTAPEICVVELHSYYQNADVWSLGITAIEIAEKKPPLFDDHDPLIALLHIIEYDPPSLRLDTWSEDFKEFVATCLVKNPSNRVTSHQLLEKHHKFLSLAKNPQYTLSNLVRNTLLVLDKYNREANYMQSLENSDYSPSMQESSSIVHEPIRKTGSETITSSDVMLLSSMTLLSSSESELSIKTPQNEGQSDFDDLFQKFDQLEEYFDESAQLEDSCDEATSQSSDKSATIDSSTQEALSKLVKESSINQDTHKSNQSYISTSIVSSDDSSTSISPTLKLHPSRSTSIHYKIHGFLSVRNPIAHDSTVNNAMACYDQMRQDHQKQLKALLKKLEKAMSDFKQRCWKHFETHIVFCEKEMTKLRSKHMSTIEEMAKIFVNEEKNLARELKDKYECALKSLHDKLNDDYAQVRKSANRSLTGVITKEDFETNKSYLERDLAESHDLSALQLRYDFRRDVLLKRQKLDQSMMSEELNLLKTQMENAHELMIKNHASAESLELAQLEEYSNLRLSLVAKQYESETSRLLDVHKKQLVERRRSLIKQSDLSSKTVRTEVQGVINDFQHRMKEYQKEYQESIRQIKRDCNREEKTTKLQTLQEERDDFIMKMQKELKEKKMQIVSTQIKYAPEDAPEMVSLIQNQKLEINRLANSHSVKTSSLESRIESEKIELLKSIKARLDMIDKKCRDECQQFAYLSESREKEMGKYHSDELLKLKNSYESNLNSILNPDVAKSTDGTVPQHDELANPSSKISSKLDLKHRRQNSGCVFGPGS